MFFKILIILVAVWFLYWAIDDIRQGGYLDAVASFGVSFVLVGLFFFNRSQEKQVETFLVWLNENKNELKRDRWNQLMWKGVPLTYDSSVTQYQFCMSFLLVTFRQQTGFVLDQSSNRSLVNIISTIVTIIFGWWGIPWGPIYSVQTIFRNLRGGNKKSIEELIIDLENAGLPAGTEESTMETGGTTTTPCPQCGSPIQADSSFCNQCGTELTPDIA